MRTDAWPRWTAPAAILLLAAALRVGAAVPDLYHFYDEVWQYLEPAYGLVHGRWIRTWEYREAIRSWLLPTIFAGPFAVSAGVGVGAYSAIVAIRVVLALLSAGIVWAAMAMAGRISRTHAIVSGLVLATAFELLFFAPRPLSEAIATSLLVPAVALLTAGRRSTRSLVGAGLLLGLAVVVRFQLAPMLAVIAIGTLRTDRRAWGCVLVGAGVGLALDAIASVAQGAVPFAWAVDNVRLNLLAGVSERYGTMPPWWYAAEFVRGWPILALPLMLLVVVGARRVPIVVAAALVNVVVHSAIAHKELRFVYPSMPLLLLAAAIGAVDLVRRLPRGQGRIIGATAVASLFATMTVASALAVGDGGRVLGRRQIAMWRAVHAEPAVCGYAVLADKPGLLSSHAFIDRDAPHYMFAGRTRLADLAAQRGAFDTVTAAADRRIDLARLSYAQTVCFAGDFCLYRRPGPCSPGDPHFLENAVLRRMGQ